MSSATEFQDEETGRGGDTIGLPFEELDSCLFNASAKEGVVEIFVQFGVRYAYRAQI